MTLKGSRTVATGGAGKRAIRNRAPHRPTQEPEAIETFGEVLRQGAPEAGEELMSYAQQLEERGEARGKAIGKAIGEERGRIQAQIEMIENLLRLGEDWSRIEAIAGVSEAEFDALKQRLSELSA